MANKKLKQAMEEIKQVLLKHDIAALVFLHTIDNDDELIGQGEYLFALEPSYSCVKMTHNEIRVRAMAEDFKGDREKQQRVIRDTANMLDMLSEMAMEKSLIVGMIAKSVNEETGAEHTPLREV